MINSLHFAPTNEANNAPHERKSSSLFLGVGVFRVLVLLTFDLPLMSYDMSQLLLELNSPSQRVPTCALSPCACKAVTC